MYNKENTIVNDLKKKVIDLQAKMEDYK